MPHIPTFKSVTLRVITGASVTAAAVSTIAFGASGAAAASTTCPTGTSEGPNGAYCYVAFTDAAAAATWTVPADVTSIDILAIGGGGGGGDAAYSGAGGGGGGGAVKVFTNQPVATGDALTVTVGAGGAGGAQYSAGQNGAASSVVDGSKWTNSAAGGNAGYDGTGGATPDSNMDGGASGNGNLGGQGMSPSGYQLMGGGGAGAGGAGQSVPAANGHPSMSPADFATIVTTDGMTAGEGGVGLVPTGGLFGNETTAFAGGGGGGAITQIVNGEGYHETAGAGQNGGGTGGDANMTGIPHPNPATAATPNTGAGGGGASLVSSYDGSFISDPNQGSYVAASDGASGYVEIRFVPYVKPVVVVAAQHPSAKAYFGLDKTTLSPAAVTMLNAFVREVVKDKVTHVVIEGFADEQGALAHNEGLSKTRASVVAGFIRAALAKAGDHKVAVTESGKGVLKSGASYQLDRVVAITSK